MRLEKKNDSLRYLSLATLPSYRVDGGPIIEAVDTSCLSTNANRRVSLTIRPSGVRPLHSLDTSLPLSVPPWTVYQMDGWELDFEIVNMVSVASWMA